MSITEPYPGTQAVLRAIALLKTFTDEQPERGLAELARVVGLNKTTTYRLLTALESEGLVIRHSGTEAYRLGPEAIVLGGRALRANDLRSVSRPELEAVVQQTGETATLEALSEEQVLILDEISSNFLVGVTQNIGSQWPLHATSTGKVILAHLSKAELQRLLHSPLASFTPKTVSTVERLQRELAVIREQGYAVAAEEIEVGFIAVGAPIHNHDGKVIAAVSVGGPSARLTEEKIPEMAHLVKDTARRISAKLGFRSSESRPSSSN